jgi:hypothetical protein
MNKFLLLALAPLAALAVPASAQTTVQRTVSTRTVHTAPTVVHRTVVRTHRHVTYGPRARVNRHCTVRWRHHRRIRTCRTVAHL